MPPPKTKKSLTAAQVDLLKRWIASGAEYQPHWSLIAPKKPEPPAVKAVQRVRNPIDRFLLAKLEAQGLSFAPEADRRTLARRLSLDLTGLPPEPEVVDAFVADTAPDAYEKLVDRFLNSDRWGEHRGRYWLDAARYADSHGIHFDNYREIWAYRDWVINAFNKNVPFDRFTIEQLAGDLLPNHTLDQQVASGFNRCNITTNEGGTIPEEYAVLYTRDRTETASQVWIGLTANCAVCHDHKFDPISQHEFYEMAAFFNNTTQNAMDGNIKDTPPTVFVPRPGRPRRWETIGKQLADLNAKAGARRQTAQADFERWIAAVSPAMLGDTVPADGLKFLAPLSEGAGDAAGLVTSGAWRVVEHRREIRLGSWTRRREGASNAGPASRSQAPEVGDFEKNQPFSFGAWVQIPKNATPSSILARMDEGDNYRGWDLWIENGRFASHFVSKWPEDAFKVVTHDPFPEDQWVHLFAAYDGSGKASGMTFYVNGQAQPLNVAVDTLKGSIRTKTPWKLGQRSNGSRLNNLTVQDVRVYNRALPAAEVIAPVAVEPRPLADRRQSPRPNAIRAETAELFAWYLADHDPEFKTLSAEIAAAEQEQAELRGRGTIAHVMAGKARDARARIILFRGEYDKRRDPVKPDTPDALPPMPADLPRNRLGFAQWLLRPEHPLTARVTVNRFWQELFGTGIVRTAGDFGVSGELAEPSRTARLAGRRLPRIGLGRQAVLQTARDVRRLSTVGARRRRRSSRKTRKTACFRAGLGSAWTPRWSATTPLQPAACSWTEIGGPSVKPYQPEGVWEAVAMIGSNTRDYQADTGANLYRRSMYTFWKRAAPPASMDIFNAPSREVCTVRRERTNTPLQALVTLNDPQFVEADRHLAELTLKSGSITEARLEFLAKRLLARPLSVEEAKIVNASLADLTAYLPGPSLRRRNR